MEGREERNEERGTRRERGEREILLKRGRKSNRLVREGTAVCDTFDKSVKSKTV